MGNRKEILSKIRKIFNLLTLLLALNFAFFTFGACVLQYLSGGPYNYQGSSIQTTDIYVLNESSSKIKLIKKIVNSSGNYLSEYSYFPEQEFDLGEEAYFYKNNVDFYEFSFSDSDDTDVAEIPKLANLYEIYQVDSEGNETLIHKACGWPKSWQENPPENWTCCSETYDKYGLGFIDYEQTEATCFAFNFDDAENLEIPTYINILITISDSEVKWEITEISD